MREVDATPDEQAPARPRERCEFSSGNRRGCDLVPTIRCGVVRGTVGRVYGSVAGSGSAPNNEERSRPRGRSNFASSKSGRRQDSPRIRNGVEGCAFGGVKGRTQLPALVQDYMDGKLKVDEFITHRQPLDNINQAFSDMKAGDCIRCVVNMREG